MRNAGTENYLKIIFSDCNQKSYTAIFAEAFIISIIIFLLIISQLHPKQIFGVVRELNKILADKLF